MICMATNAALYVLESSLGYSSSKIVIRDFRTFLQAFCASLRENIAFIRGEGIQEEFNDVLTSIEFILEELEKRSGITLGGSPSIDEEEIVELYKTHWLRPQWTDDMILEGFANSVTKAIGPLIFHSKSLASASASEPLRSSITIIIEDTQNLQSAWMQVSEFIKNLPPRMYNV